MSETLTDLILKSTVALIAPVISTLFYLLFPVGSWPHENYDRLHRRNNWIDKIAIALCCICFSSAFLLYLKIPTNDPWGFAFGIGYMVILPSYFIIILTLIIGGFKRLKEFWIFYQIKYQVNGIGIALFCLPLVFLGMMATPKVIERLLT